ncbi:t21 [Tupaiid betaherpesvirus 1]|uniref:T21 n=1 Tax=Tupaiid herpesvirus 1 (strain 1) TaxID=10397 RepID=Q91TU0_TUHV1|nr:t21 [Tupaiid betaherpesvirus 1]AAK57047.1 t21 [Tupaiid betaherpesvirus 1]
MLDTCLFRVVCLLYASHTFVDTNDFRQMPIDNSSMWPPGLILQAVDRRNAIKIGSYSGDSGVWPPTVYARRTRDLEDLLVPRLNIPWRMCNEELTPYDWKNMRCNNPRKAIPACDIYQMQVSWETDAVTAKSAEWDPLNVRVRVTEANIMCSMRSHSSGRPCSIILLHETVNETRRVISVALSDAPFQLIRLDQTCVDGWFGKGFVLMLGPSAIACDTPNSNGYSLTVFWDSVATDGVWQCDVWFCQAPRSQVARGRGRSGAIDDYTDISETRGPGPSVHPPDILHELSRSSGPFTHIDWKIFVLTLYLGTTRMSI